MRVAIVFAGLMVEIVFFEWSKLLQPLIDIVNQPALMVIYINPGSDVHGGDQSQAIAYAAGVNNFFHLRRYMNVLAMVLGVKGEIFSMKFHARACPRVVVSFSEKQSI
jgi:hypothetical protein